jgi:hypothetical protein
MTHDDRFDVQECTQVEFPATYTPPEAHDLGNCVDLTHGVFPINIEDDGGWC